MEMLVTKFSNGKYRNEGELFQEPISNENVKLMGEMIALQALRTVKKYDMKVADRLYIGLIKDLHHMGEIDYIVSDGYDVAQTAICLDTMWRRPQYAFCINSQAERYRRFTAKTARAKKSLSNLHAIVRWTTSSIFFGTDWTGAGLSLNPLTLRIIRLCQWIL